MTTRKDYWKKVLDEAVEQLDEMRAERETREAELKELNTGIMQLEQLLSSLAPFTSEEPQDDTIIVQGVTNLELADAIREVLRVSEQYRTPRGVRDSLRASDYDLDQHPNALASIHGVLKRLVESREVEVLNAKGKTYYRSKDIPLMEKVRTAVEDMKSEGIRTAIKGKSGR